VPLLAWCLFATLFFFPLLRLSALLRLGPLSLGLTLLLRGELLLRF
jgi:hypothetical protein